MNKNKKNWWLDIVLLGSFIVTFMMDLTGLELHQWIGILAGVIVLVHMILHWNWISPIFHKFFGKVTRKARFYFLVDLTLIVGILTIIFTGVVISSWLSLSLGNYAVWSAVHFWASMITLQVVMVKIAFHWKWIVNVAKTRLFPRKEHDLKPIPQPVQAAIPASSRREFLKIGAAVGVAALFEGAQLVKVFQNVSNVQARALASESTDNFSASPLADVTGDQSPSSEVLEENTIDTSTSQAVVSPTSTPAAVDQVQSPATTACTFRCPRGCTYPGHCRRYTDSNNNGRCDLGECM